MEFGAAGRARNGGGPGAGDEWVAETSDRSETEELHSRIGLTGGGMGELLATSRSCA